jgi:type II secretory pathway predicted ATPase ExeA
MSGGTSSKSPTDRREWRQRPMAERIAYANKLLVLHPRFREAVALLERCHQSSKQAGEPICGAILGSSGVGKTSVVDHYRRLHPPRETDTANCQPVLKVTLQPDARPKGIAADLLLALGDPAWSSGTVESLTNRAARLLKHCGVELIVLDEFHHLFDVDRAKVMTKASQWLKVLIVNTGLPVVVCGMPEAEYVLSAEHTERRFKQRLTLRCFMWRTPQGQREFCGMLKKLDETLPLAETSSLANADLAGRFYLASRGVPDYLMTLVRGAAAEAVQRGNEQIEMDDLARIFERCLAQQRVLAEQSNPFIGDLDKTALDRVQAADQTRAAGVGLSPRARGAKRRPTTATDYLGGRQ